MGKENADAYYNDTDNGFVKYAMAKKTNEAGQNVNCYEFVIQTRIVHI